jgi:hypothetical protein
LYSDCGLTRKVVVEKDLVFKELSQVLEVRDEKNHENPVRIIVWSMSISNMKQTSGHCTAVLAYCGGSEKILSK